MNIEELKKDIEKRLKGLKTSQEVYDNFDTIELIELILGRELDIEWV